ncbi:MAG: cysteine synthase family protein [Proteobacteria bacterium]|nr:cysteine synthase family protein [Pseudomonadota bacterium]
MPRPDAAALSAIGRTPLVELRRIVPPQAARVFVKLEAFNPTGSYKDRMALAMIEQAERRGELRPGMTVVEYTGGSTGSSLAFVCACKGYRFRVVSSDAFAPAKLRTMQAFGAELEIVASAGGRITPDLIPRMMERARTLAAAPDAYFTDQIRNRDSLIGYEGIGSELLEQLPDGIDAFAAAVGGAGMLMGVARVLRSRWPATRIVALEPASAPLLTRGEPGTHHVEGIGIGIVPPLLDRALCPEARAIDESEARAVCRRLAREEGILAGTSSGLNVAGALALASELGPGRVVATVACDSGLKYLDGDLYDGV